MVATYEYDRYSSGSALTFQTVSGLSLSADQSRVKGLKTYEKVYNTDNSSYAERRFYYDSKARLIQTVERNHLGYTSRYSYEYDFMGNLLTAHESHQVNSSTTHTVLKRNTYDHRNRLLTTTTTLNSGTPATVTYAYNELGQLQTKKLGSTSTVTSQYNIQGWLTSQTSPKFSLALDYFSTGRRDGNITKLSWGHGSATDQYYTLNYDKFGRMTTGVHSLNKFNENIGSYDLNGNIKSLTRTANGSTSDNFTYTYNGNRLTNLSGISGTYTYDNSGNLAYDPRKNLNFTWNSLNTPKEIMSGSTVKAKYLYSYDGTKVKVQDSGNTNGYDYLGGLTLVKTNNILTPEYHFGEGVIRGNEVMYFEKDHLGSTRVVLNTSGTVLEKNDYYPFGMRHANSAHSLTANNRYKFNGKEDQTIGSLNLLDYGARMYDGQIGRWLGVDAMADKYYPVSPYAYCANDPIKYIDPTGMLFGDYYSGYSGKFLFSDGIDDNKVYIRNLSVDGDELVIETTFIGKKEDIPDKTDIFNAFLEKTEKYFSDLDKKLKKRESNILFGGLGKYKRKLQEFRKLVTDGAPYDIKVAEGGAFSIKNRDAFRNGYAFYDNQLFRYDDFGNFNYGVAGKAFGLSEFILELGAGVNQLSKPNVPHSIFSYGDEDKDNYMIRQGFKYYNKKFNK